MSGNARARDGIIYVVNWPEFGFFKLGFAVDDRRWRSYVNRGGELVGLTRPLHESATVVEPRMHRWLKRLGMPQAFDAKADAAVHLGHNGAGWTECYQAEAHHGLHAFDVYSRRQMPNAELIKIDEFSRKKKGA